MCTHLHTKIPKAHGHAGSAHISYEVAEMQWGRSVQLNCMLLTAALESLKRRSKHTVSQPCKLSIRFLNFCRQEENSVYIH
jgi:hypothetical protein